MIKVLCPTDASFGNSGYAAYARQVLAGLHRAGYEVIELGCFAQSHDPRAKSLPWKFIGNVPMDPSQMSVYNQGRNPYGQFLFEQLVLDLEPDVVMDFRDAYMFEFEEVSPFRDYFHWVILAAVDSSPPPNHWLTSYRNADTVLSYEQFGIDVMNEYGCGQIKTIGIAPACPDSVYQFTTDRGLAKSALGLNPGLFSIGTVMRNQPRKLYSELIESFSRYLKLVPPEIAAKSILHLHTAASDAGWSMSDLIKHSDCSNKIIFTYMCDACQAVFAAHFTDGKQYCKRCGQPTAHHPNVANGLSTQALASVYQSFDAYVQFANCLVEGEEILTENGWKNIENVEIGEKVMTHTGKYHKVLNTFHRDVEEYYEIKIVGDFESLKITGEHPVYVIKNKDNGKRSTREQLGDQLRSGKELSLEPKFIEVNKIQPKDLLFMPIDDTVIDIQKIDLLEYLNNNKVILEKNNIVYNKGKSVPRYIEIDEDFCKLLGLFVADGGIDECGQVKITQGNDKIKNESFLRTQFDKLSNGRSRTRQYKDRNAIDIGVSSKALKLFFETCYNENKEKILPSWVMKLPFNKQFCVIQGMFMGDGCIRKDKEISMFSNTSKVLANQLKDILRRLRIYFHCHKLVRGGNRKDSYCFDIKGNLLNGYKNTSRRNTRGLYYKNYYISNVKSIEFIEEKKEVFNIEVDNDNSYVTRICAAHNCEALGIPQLEASATGCHVFSTDYSAMADVVRKVAGTPIKVASLARDALSGSHQIRAMPDMDDLAIKLKEFACKSTMERGKLSYNTAKTTCENYTWKNTIDAWDNAIKFALKNKKKDWRSPVKIHTPNMKIPDIKDNNEFIEWCYDNIAGRPEMKQKFIYYQMMRGLNDGCIISGGNVQAYTRDMVINECVNICQVFNVWEQKRANKFGLT